MIDDEQDTHWLWDGWFFRLLFLVAAPALAVVVLVFAGQELGSAWSAHLREGTAGTFTADHQRCSESGRGGRTCHWRGDFVSDDGTVSRDDVRLRSGAEVPGPGGTVDALDVGGDVFPADGGSDWFWTTLLVVAATGGLIWWAWTLQRAMGARPRRDGAYRPARGDPLQLDYWFWRRKYRFWRWPIMVLVPFFGLLAFLGAAVFTGPALSAFLGNGTPGVFTAERQTCPDGPEDKCEWHGGFASDDGTIRHDSVRLAEDVILSGPGATLRAQDTGGRRAVYLIDGGSEWFGSAFMGLLSLAGLIWWVYAIVRARRTRPSGPAPTRAASDRAEFDAELAAYADEAEEVTEEELAELDRENALLDAQMARLDRDIARREDRNKIASGAPLGLLFLAVGVANLVGLDDDLEVGAAVTCVVIGLVGVAFAVAGIVGLRRMRVTRAESTSRQPL